MTTFLDIVVALFVVPLLLTTAALVIVALLKLLSFILRPLLPKPKFQVGDYVICTEYPYPDLKKVLSVNRKLFSFRYKLTGSYIYLPEELKKVTVTLGQQVKYHGRVYTVTNVSSQFGSYYHYQLYSKEHGNRRTYYSELEFLPLKLYSKRRKHASKNRN